MYFLSMGRSLRVRMMHGTKEFVTCCGQIKQRGMGHGKRFSWKHIRGKFWYVVWNMVRIDQTELWHDPPLDVRLFGDYRRCDSYFISIGRHLKELFP